MFSTVHEIGREQRALIIKLNVVFCAVHEVGREQEVLTISDVFSTVHEREEYFLSRSLYIMHYPRYSLTSFPT